MNTPWEDVTLSSEGKAQETSSWIVPVHNCIHHVLLSATV